MNLLRCDIHNFRSIKNITIDFDKNLKIFIGYNEAGKSNIIKALSLLNQKFKFSEDDVRSSYSDEKYEEDSYVRFVFEFNKLEIENIFKNMLNKIFIKNEKDIEALSKFCNDNKQINYKVDLKNKNSYYVCWTVDKINYPSMEGRIKKIKENTQGEVIIDDKKYPLNNYKYIFIDEKINVQDKLIEDANFDNVIDLYFEEKKVPVSNSYPEVVFWSYNDFQNIPQRINITSFINNPNSCISLKNMFNLSDIYEIKDEILNSKNRKNGLVNLLRRVANMTTEYIHSVWPEQKLIKINLNENGENIEFAIEDEKNIYEFSRRSDGFKRFMSFLLSIGAQNKASKIKDIILLIDEPDIGLHPSSSRQLMNELINIANNNFVYYSTHSIFMINKEDINSHYIVKKESEITKIDEIKSTDIMDIEILYNALGYSAFEVLKRNNIIFEGWRDKNLFTLGLKYLHENEQIIKISQEIGFCHSQGVKDIHRITEILDLAKRNYVIISDADKPAKEAREKSHEKDKWLTYNDLEKNIITCEDFFIKEYNNTCFLEACEKNTVTINLGDINKQPHLIAQYSDILKKNNIEKEIHNKILNDYKELLYKNITDDILEESYFNFIEKLILNIDSFTTNPPIRPENINNAS